MTDAEKEELRAKVSEVTAQFGPWHQALLDYSPDVLRRYHELMVAMGELEGVDPRVRHLIWVAVDAVATHLYPRGIGVHALKAVAHGATIEQVFEALEIASLCIGRSFSVGLRVLDDILEQAGMPPLAPADSTLVSPTFTPSAETGWSEWMHRLSTLAPDYAQRLTDFSMAPRGPSAIGARDRAIIAFAVCACPAVLDQSGMNFYGAAALDNGATKKDLFSALVLASAIGIHSLSVGAPAVVDKLVEEGRLDALPSNSTKPAS